MTSAGIVAFVTHGLPALRSALRGIRETAPADVQIAVVASDLEDYDATYLLRQHLRGRIQALRFELAGVRGDHCGLGRVLSLVEGEYLARVDDTVAFERGWLERAVEVLELDPTLGCLSLLPPADYQRGRGRPRTVNVEPIEVDRLDMRCFVIARELVEIHEYEGMERRSSDCSLQEYLVRHGRRLAFLPGLAGPLGDVPLPQVYDARSHEAELPLHEGATSSMQRLRQGYQIGEDVLLICLACGCTELETLAARIRFCQRHGVAIGFWYELRCTECGELHYQEDYQFRCPD